jgi:ParB-like chromosome segregation protein Spo0J
MSYELHPLCTLFPRVDGAEFDALVADVKANGLRQPIVLHDGMILDGGNRYRACVEAGVKPTFVKFDGDNLVSFVLSANLHRRHLSTGQQAAIVASAQDWAKAQRHGGDRKSEQSATLHLDSVAKRAAESGASVRTQKMADKVVKADPALAKRVAHGDVSLPKAVAKVEGKPAKKPKRQLAAVPDEIAGYDPRDDELKEAHQTASELAAENDRLKDQIAVESMDASEEAKTQAAGTIATLRAENTTLLAELAAVKVSRDAYQRENNELKKQCATQQREIKKLRLAFEKRAA